MPRKLWKHRNNLRMRRQGQQAELEYHASLGIESAIQEIVLSARSGVEREVLATVKKLYPGCPFPRQHTEFHALVQARLDAIAEGYRVRKAA